ncbi:hypothetical protein [Aeromonas phage phiA014S]|uniref:Uncharacterized protein n=1 Tax=Aeromonas phage phiA014S TaxID=3119845 RepID=A0ABZ2CLY5_9CAUD
MMFKIARFVLARLASSLAREAARSEAGVKAAVAKRNKKVAALDTEIIAMANREEKIIADIRAKADAEIANVLNAKRAKMDQKAAHRQTCGAQCRHLSDKAESARLMRSRIEGLLK